MAFVYPTSAELREVEQEKLPRLIANRPVFEIVPIEESDSHLVEWEQEDNWTGLQQIRGLNGPFNRVKKVGAKRYAVIPGVYGEYMDLDELEMTTRREIGTWDRPVDIRREVMRMQDRLLERRLDRIEKILWDLLTTGTYSVSGDGGVLATDTYTLQTFTSTVAWATAATATPIADFRSVALLARGKGVTFGMKSTAWMNRVTFNKMVANTNANDLGGRFQIVGGGKPRSEANTTDILTAEDLPRVRVYDEGYLDDSGTFQPYIANDTVVVVGARTNGAKVADYAMTRNSNNPGTAPGPYTDVIESKEPPKRVSVYDGHNGGPRVYFPSAIVVMDVTP